MDLGSLGLWSWAYDINYYDEVVGRSLKESGETRAFIWKRQIGIEELDILPGNEDSTAFGINDLGQIVGDQDLIAHLWESDGRMTNLGHLGGNWSRAFDINELEQVVGSSRIVPGGPHRAFIWTKEGGIEDIGITPTEGFSTAMAINDLRQVTGYLYDPALDEVSSFVWTQDEGIRDLGNLGGNRTYAHDINNREQVAGTSVTEDGVPHPFLWDSDNGMQDLSEMLLPGSEWLLEWSYGLSPRLAINDAGQIAGSGRLDPDGDGSFDTTHAFLMTPLVEVTTDLDYYIDMTLSDTFSFDYWWEMGQEPEGCNLDILFFVEDGWKFLGWELNFDGSSAEWETASFWVPPWARGLETQIMFKLFDYGEYTDPTVYLRDIRSEPVPEPGTLLLVASGLIGLAGFRKRFKKS